MSGILAILGSRNPEGRTAGAAEAFAGPGEKVFLPEKNIERCRQCGIDGWGACKSEGRCEIQDDFGLLAENVRAAEAVVFATPVYFSDLSESMRAFLGRLRRVARHENGRKGVSGKPAFGICVAGGGGGGAPACALILEKLLVNCGFSPEDFFAVRRQNFEMKIQSLEMSGAWYREKFQKP